MVVARHDHFSYPSDGMSVARVHGIVIKEPLTQLAFGSGP